MLSLHEMQRMQSNSQDYWCLLTKSLHAHGEGELVITLESWEVTRASRRVEEGLSRAQPLESSHRSIVMIFMKSEPPFGTLILFRCKVLLNQWQKIKQKSSLEDKSLNRLYFKKESKSVPEGSSGLQNILPRALFPVFVSFE